MKLKLLLIAIEGKGETSGESSTPYLIPDTKLRSILQHRDSSSPSPWTMSKGINTC